jgi:molybdate transport system regulatory protein
LLIRYTAARLNEVLNLDPIRDIDYSNHSVAFRKAGKESDSGARDVQIPELLTAEIQNKLDLLKGKQLQGKLFKIDPAHARRKFYERARATGIPRDLVTPEAIRRSRAVELMQGNVPLPVVQKILGHSTPNLAASYVEFSQEEIRQVERNHIARENRRKTSARNAFFGKVDKIRKGDIQSIIEMVSVGGFRICAIITNDSQRRLGLRSGSLVVAEVKAPWVTFYKSEHAPVCAAENRFRGTVARILRGRVATEIVIHLQDGTELCSVITEQSRRILKIKETDPLWAVFSAFAVVIHTD